MYSPVTHSPWSCVGADLSITAFIVILTGVLGASVSKNILSSLGIEDPLSVGLAVGASSHGIGDDLHFLYYRRFLSKLCHLHRIHHLI